MKYFINNEEMNEENFYSKLEEVINDYVYTYYDELLDDCYEPIQIGYATYSASEILKNCDPIAYRCGISEEESYQLEEAQSELERSNEFEIYGYTFECIEEDEETGETENNEISDEIAA